MVDRCVKLDGAGYGVVRRIGVWRGGVGVRQRFD